MAKIFLQVTFLISLMVYHIDYYADCIQSLFVEDNSSCWSSGSGSPQYVLLDFGEPVVPSEIRIMFQGGFAGSEMVCCIGEAATEHACVKEVARFEAEDNNEWQSFSLPQSGGDTTLSDQPQGFRALKIVFPHTSDFYGRVTVYRLDVYGSRSS